MSFNEAGKERAAMNGSNSQQKKGRKILGMNNKSSSNNTYTTDINNVQMNNNNSNTNNSDRVRLPNLIPQDIHTMWPYAHYIPQVLAAPPGFSMIQSPYPIPIYQPGSIQAIPPAAANQIRNPSDTNNMLIQIGLQCVNQNNAVNINTINEMTQGGNKQMPSASSPHEVGNTFAVEGATSPQDISSTAVLMEQASNVENFLKDCNQRFYNNSHNPASGDSSSLSPEQFRKITSVALNGSDIAERLAYSHRNRPCFKKIDSLCARMKQDLNRPDGVLPNINSQGIAWAVKDFIFVFTRVINAWIIIKGYVYNTPDGLNRVKSALSPTFTRTFAAWQDTTLDFVEDLIKSFVNLDHLVQSQKMTYQKSDSPMKSTPVLTPESKLTPNNLDDSGDLLTAGKDTIDSLSRGYMYTLVEDSEESQRKANTDGSYFKTGTYNPIKKSPKTDAVLMNLSPSKEHFEADFSGEEDLSKMFAMCDEVMALQMQSKLMGVPQLPYPFLQQSSFADTDAIGSAIPDSPLPLSKDPTFLNYDIRVLQKNLSNYSKDFDVNEIKPLGVDLIEKLNMIIDRIMNFSHASLFFKIEFAKNYFPDFVAKHHVDIVDLQSVLMKCQLGGYWHIYEVIHDMKTVNYQARQFLKSHKNTALDLAISDYEKEVEDLLKEKIFENYQFDHICGEPNEILYNSGK